MHIVHDLDSLHSPIITIGTFDGIHIGHQALLAKMTSFSEKTLVLTFSNHPAQILSSTPPPLLTTLSHKLQLLKDHGIDTTLLLPFTKEFAAQNPLQFLTTLKNKLQFKHLILGHDAVIGHRQQGTPAHLQKLASELNFTLTYIDPITHNNQPISSSHIRNLVEKCQFTQIEPLLGRPYSILAPVQPGLGKGKAIGFPTLNLNVDGLCLPPSGVYIVKANNAPAIANLGFAPTLQTRRTPVLEVHLFDSPPSVPPSLDIQFLKCLRPENKFIDKEALVQQIQLDIEQAKAYFN